MAAVLHKNKSNAAGSSKRYTPALILFHLEIVSDLGFRFALVKPSVNVYNTSVTKQWMTKWPCIANDVFRIVHNHGKTKVNS